MVLFRQCPLPPDVPGKLWLHSMPGKNEDWNVFVENAKSADVKGIACMTSRAEVQEKSPSYAEAISKDSAPCKVLEFAIPPGGVPEDAAAFNSFIASLITLVREGQGVLVHCTGGVGRTGFVAICMLQRLGMDLEDAKARVREAGSGPETDEQHAYLKSFAERGASMGV